MAHTVILRKTDGRVTTDVELGYLFSTLQNGTYSMTIKRASEKRSINQNDLMWMWFALMERETGTNKQDIHDYYCKKFLRRTVEFGGHVEVVVGGTKGMTKASMSEFMTKIQADALTEFGIQLPVPEDRYFEQFYQQFNY